MGSIAPHAGQQYADGACARSLGHRLKQHIHRRAQVIHRRSVIHSTHVPRPGAFDFQVAVPGRHIGVSREHLLAVLGFQYPQGTAVVQAPGECRAEGFGDVLGDDRAGSIGRQLREHFANGFSAAGGGADGQNDVGGAERCAGGTRVGRRRRCHRGTDADAGGRLHLGDEFRAVIAQRHAQVRVRLGQEINRPQRQRIQGHFCAALGEG